MRRDLGEIGAQAVCAGHGRAGGGLAGNGGKHACIDRGEAGGGGRVAGCDQGGNVGHCLARGEALAQGGIEIGLPGKATGQALDGILGRGGLFGHVVLGDGGVRRARFDRE